MLSVHRKSEWYCEKYETERLHLINQNTVFKMYIYIYMINKILIIIIENVMI